jgi:hypothetical protein
MSFVPSLLPWQWAILAAVPLGIVLLYFLKLRRQKISVPSTFLWSKTIEDLHVNSLFQRLRRNLLLLLQLLAIALAALALLRPGIRDDAASTGRKVFLLDSSGSMQSTDVSPDANRFEQAKRLIGEAIDAMSDGDVAMLIAFSDRTDVLQSFTSDRRRLREALSRAKVTSRPTDILEALRAAEGLANPNRTSQAGDVNDVQVADAMPADLLLYSDGGFTAARDFDLGNLKPTYVRIGGDRPNNLAILAFSAERNSELPDQVQAFATVANLGAVLVGATATLSLDGAFVDAEEVLLEPGEETGLSFLLNVEEAARLELSLDAADDLSLDNVAHTGISPLRLVNVLVITPGNAPLDLALTTGQAASMCLVETVSPDYLADEGYRQRAAAGRDDLIIYDRCAPEVMPLSNTFFIGSLPPQNWERGETTNQILLVDIDRSHPIMRYLELFSLLIAEGATLTPPPGSSDLLVAENGPILSLAPRDGYQDLVLGFEILSSTADGSTSANTDWQVQRSWPVFILNLLRYLAGAADAATMTTYRPGETVSIRTENRQSSVEIHSPDGQRQLLTAGPAGSVLYSRTEEIGFYDIRDATERTIDRFAVNLFDRQESSLAAADTVVLGYESVDATVATIARRREYWRVILLGVLGVMTLEWWFYSRRLG